jgi:hypothetical protein
MMSCPRKPLIGVGDLVACHLDQPAMGLALSHFAMRVASLFSGVKDARILLVGLDGAVSLPACDVVDSAASLVCPMSAWCGSSSACSALGPSPSALCTHLRACVRACERGVRVR